MANGKNVAERTIDRQLSSLQRAMLANQRDISAAEARLTNAYTPARQVFQDIQPVRQPRLVSGLVADNVYSPYISQYVGGAGKLQAASGAVDQAYRRGVQGVGSFITPDDVLAPDQKYVRDLYERTSGTLAGAAETALKDPRRAYADVISAARGYVGDERRIAALRNKAIRQQWLRDQQKRLEKGQVLAGDIRSELGFLDKQYAQQQGAIADPLRRYTTEDIAEYVDPNQLANQILAKIKPTSVKWQGATVARNPQTGMIEIHTRGGFNKQLTEDFLEKEFEKGLLANQKYLDRLQFDAVRRTRELTPETMQEIRQRDPSYRGLNDEQFKTKFANDQIQDRLKQHIGLAGKFRQREVGTTHTISQIKDWLYARSLGKRDEKLKELNYMRGKSAKFRSNIYEKSKDIYSKTLKGTAQSRQELITRKVPNAVLQQVDRAIAQGNTGNLNNLIAAYKGNPEIEQAMQSYVQGKKTEFSIQEGRRTLERSAGINDKFFDKHYKTINERYKAVTGQDYNKEQFIRDLRSGRFTTLEDALALDPKKGEQVDPTYYNPSLIGSFIDAVRGNVKIKNTMKQAFDNIKSVYDKNINRIMNKSEKALAIYRPLVSTAKNSPVGRTNANLNELVLNTGTEMKDVSSGEAITLGEIIKDLNVSDKSKVKVTMTASVDGGEPVVMITSTDPKDKDQKALAVTLPGSDLKSRLRNEFAKLFTGTGALRSRHLRSDQASDIYNLFGGMVGGVNLQLANIDGMQDGQERPIQLANGVDVRIKKSGNFLYLNNDSKPYTSQGLREHLGKLYLTNQFKTGQLR